MSTTAIDERSARPLRWWDLSCAGVLLFVAVILVIDALAGEPTWAAAAPFAWRLGMLAAPILLFAVLYISLGRAAILRGSSGPPATSRGGAFLVLLILVLALGTFCDPMYAMLQAVAYPMVWTIAHDYRTAVMWCLAVSIAVGGGLYLGLVSENLEAALFSSLVTAIVSLVFAIAIGTWISRIHDRGEGYRKLADELRRTQDEVAALSESAGASAERERLSRDLHDTLTQTLAGLVMLSEQAERALDAGDEGRARDRLTRVGSAARAAVAEARALVATTQPIGEGGLLPAIERVATTLREDTGLDVQYSLEPAPLSREAEVVLLRAVQEGLANARKHARASRVWVTLESRPADGEVRLTLDDDGVGPGSGTREGGFGLTGLADRAQAVGGRLHFGPREGGGSRLEILLAVQS